jgi:hypothetical protein
MPDQKPASGKFETSVTEAPGAELTTALKASPCGL